MKQTRLYIMITIIVLIIITCNRWCNLTGREYYTDRITEGKKNPKVYDIAHKHLPEMTKYSMVSDITTILLVSVPFLFAKSSKPIIEYLIYAIVIFAIRGIIINLTILPKDKTCVDDNETILGGCYDKIFSGHSASVVLASLVFYKYKIITSVPLLVMMNVVNNLFLLLSRYHYSVDVIIAIIISFAIYRNEALHGLIDSVNI